MITLACCNSRRHHSGQVFAITAGGNTGFKSLIHNGVKIFAPDWPIVDQHKKSMAILNERLDTHQIDEKEYARQAKRVDERYIAQYDEVLKRQALMIASWLDAITTESDITLVCYCPQGWMIGGKVREKFCHRQLVAQFIREVRPDLDVVCY